MLAKPTKKSSNKAALFIAGTLVLILIAAIAALIFLLIKNFTDKDIIPKEASTANINEEVKYIFLPSVKTISNPKKKVMKKDEYEWDYYKGPTDYRYLLKATGLVKDRVNMTIERKYNKGKIYVKKNPRSEKEIEYDMEYYDNTTVLLKQIKNSLNGKQKVENIEIVEKKKADNTVLLEITNKSENIIRKVEVNSAGIIKEEVYKNNELFSTINYENYYYNDVFITSLANSKSYVNNKSGSWSIDKIENVEEVDENNVKIIMVREMNINNIKILAINSEYILKRYILEEDGKVTPVDMEE